MPSALDTFRAQREAAEGVYARLTEVSHLLHDLRGQADALAQNNELRAVLHREQSWLDQAQRTMEEARRWRELEMRWFWPDVWRRGVLAIALLWLRLQPAEPATRPLRDPGRPKSARFANKRPLQSLWSAVLSR